MRHSLKTPLYPWKTETNLGRSGHTDQKSVCRWIWQTIEEYDWRTGRIRRRRTRIHFVGFLDGQHLTTWVKALRISSMYIQRISAIHIPLRFKGTWTVEKALLDSGATENFLDTRTVHRLRLATHALKEPWYVYNVDGLNNKARQITHSCQLELTYNGKNVTARFWVAWYAYSRYWYAWVMWWICDDCLCNKVDREAARDSACLR